MASNGKDRTSSRNQREFRTVDIDLNLGGGEKSHEFAVRSVEDDQLYRLRLRGVLTVDDRPRPNFVSDPAQLHFPNAVALTVFLDDRVAEFWRHDEFLFAVQFTEYALEKLSGDIFSQNHE